MAACASGERHFLAFVATHRPNHHVPSVRAAHRTSGSGRLFAVSGFLITASWLRKPKLRDFAIARGLRIFPGLWVCLAIIAFVIAPASVLIQGGSVSDLFASHKPIEYVINNGLLNVYYAGVDGTPRGVPWPGSGTGRSGRSSSR